MRQRFGLMMAALWWGSLTGLGFVFVPMLFTFMGSPAAAGGVAAKLFTAQAWIGIGCAMLMLMAFNQKDVATPSFQVQTAIKFIVAGLLLTLLVEFGIAPRIISARADGGSLKLWHGLGSALYLGQWLSSGASLWLLTRHAAVAHPPRDSNQK